MEKTIFIASIFFLLFAAAASAQSISATNSTGGAKDSFYTNETVYVTSTGNILDNSSYVWVYVVSDSNSWSGNINLTDVSTGRKLLQTNSTGSLLTYPIWLPTLTVGKYDVVVDINKDGYYNSTVDFVDSSSGTGFEVVDLPAPTIAASETSSGSSRNFNMSSGVLDNIMMKLKLVGGGAGGSSERIKINSIDFIANGTGDEKNGISMIKLIYDLNGNGAMDSDDQLIAYDKFLKDNGILTVSITGNNRLVINLTTPHYLLVDYVMSENNYNGETFQTEVLSINAVGETSGTAARVTGVPLYSPLATITGGTIKTVTTATTSACSEYKNQASCPATCNWCGADSSCKNLTEACLITAPPAPTQELPKETTSEIPNYLIWIAVPSVILIAGLLVFLFLRAGRKPENKLLEQNPNEESK